MLLSIFWSLSAEKLSLKRLIGCSSVGIWCKIVSFGLVWCIAFWYLKKMLNNSRILRIFFGVSPRICGSFLRSRWFGAHWCFGWLAFEMTLSDSSRRLNKNWLKRWSLWQKIHENPFLTMKTMTFFWTRWNLKSRMESRMGVLWKDSMFRVFGSEHCLSQFSQHSSSFLSSIGTSCTFSWESIRSQLLRRVLVTWVDTRHPLRPLECCSALKRLRKQKTTCFFSSHGFRL